MPLSDLLGSLPALVLVGLLPGVALTTIAAPRWPWWERLAMAPAVSAGVAGVLGLADHRFHTGFRAATMLPAVAVMVATAAMRRWTTRSLPVLGAPRAAGEVRLVVGMGAVAGVAAAAVLVVGLRSSPLPLERDSAIHGTVAAAIASTGDTLPAIAEPVDGSAWTRVRTGQEAEAALVSELAGPPAPSALMPLTLLAVLLLPLAIGALAWETSGSARVGAVAAPVALLAAFPSWPISSGELPLVMTTGLVVPLILSVWRGVRNEGVATAAGVAAITVGADWAVHGTEWLTAAVIGTGLVLRAIWSGHRSGAPLRGAAVVGAGLLAATVVDRLTAAPALPTSVAPSGSGSPLAETADFGALVGHRGLQAAIDELTGFQPAWQLIAVLAMLGALVALRRRQMRWAIVAETAVLVVYFDSVSVGLLRSVWVRVYPWSTDDRVMQMQLFALAPLAALGAVTLGEWLATRRNAPAWRTVTAICAGAAAIIGIVHARAIYDDAATRHPVITAVDVSLMAEMSSRLPASAVVLSDDSDAGVWISALTRQRLYMPWPYLRSHPEDARVVGLSRVCANPAAADPSLFAGIDAVYVGARQLPGMPTWDATCISRVPWLHRLAERTGPDGTAVVFSVDGSVAAPLGRPPANSRYDVASRVSGR